MHHTTARCNAVQHAAAGPPHSGRLAITSARWPSTRRCIPRASRSTRYRTVTDGSATVHGRCATPPVSAAALQAIIIVPILPDGPPRRTASHPRSPAATPVAASCGVRTRSHGRRACVRVCAPRARAAIGCTRLPVGGCDRLASPERRNGRPYPSAAAHAARKVASRTSATRTVVRAHARTRARAHARTHALSTGMAHLWARRQGDRGTARSTARKGGRADALRSRHCTRRRSSTTCCDTLPHATA
jgi:hypothetical protein